MTDRVLTEEEVDGLASLNEIVLNGLPSTDAFALLASHRALHRRHRLLLRRVRELEERVSFAEAFLPKGHLHD